MKLVLCTHGQSFPFLPFQSPHTCQWTWVDGSNLLHFPVRNSMTHSLHVLQIYSCPSQIWQAINFAKLPKKKSLACSILHSQNHLFELTQLHDEDPVCPRDQVKLSRESKSSALCYLCVIVAKQAKLVYETNNCLTYWSMKWAGLDYVLIMKLRVSSNNCLTVGTKLTG